MFIMGVITGALLGGTMVLLLLCIAIGEKKTEEQIRKSAA